MLINVRKIKPEAIVPTKIEQGDWIDLHTVEVVVSRKLDNGDWITFKYRIYKEGYTNAIPIQKGDTVVMNTGLAMQLPPGHEAIIAPRSSTFSKYGLILGNSIGVIDNSYCGNDDEWIMKFYATQETQIEIPGRFAQFRVQKKQVEVSFNEVEDLGNPNRGGFGSTDDIGIDFGWTTCDCKEIEL